MLSSFILSSWATLYCHPELFYIVILGYPTLSSWATLYCHPELLYIVILSEAKDLSPATRAYTKILRAAPSG
jgi:hypothetical protein